MEVTETAEDRFEFLEYGKLANTQRGVPDFSEMAYTMSLEGASSAFLRKLSFPAQSLFQKRHGNFSVALLSLDDERLIFVAIQQRNESELTPHSRRDYQQVRFTILPREKLRQLFAQLLLPYTALLNQHYDPEKCDYHLSDMPRRVVYKEPPAVKIPSVRDVGVFEYLLGKSAKLNWVSRIASWFTLLLNHRKLVISIPATVGLVEMLTVCQTLQLLINSIPSNGSGKGRILTFALDHVTSYIPDILFVRSGDEINSSYKDTIQLNWDSPRIDDNSKRTEQQLRYVFWGEMNETCEGIYRVTSPQRSPSPQAAFNTWQSIIVTNPQLLAMRNELFCFQLFRGQYTPKQLEEILLDLYSKLPEVEWMSLVKNVTLGIADWLLHCEQESHLEAQLISDLSGHVPLASSKTLLERLFLLLDKDEADLVEYLAYFPATYDTNLEMLKYLEETVFHKVSDKSLQFSLSPARSISENLANWALYTFPRSEQLTNAIVHSSPRDVWLPTLTRGFHDLDSALQRSYLWAIVGSQDINFALLFTLLKEDRKSTR